MDNQTLQPVVLDSQTLEALQDEIMQEMRLSLSNSKLKEIFKRYNISGEEVIKIQCSIDPTKIESNDPNSVDTITQKSIGTLSFNTCTCWSEEKDDFVNCPCH
ncbi:hypothetical protein Nos7524_4302 [Nostoc sp. PCC 7524]|uniref:hypothetical protein n=1 Tax=Nostoc sp. (strain ATCC 29411 / PCC 7524) TaxID=28072 RepID=UPI00029EFA8B|nr:hypothetical protein [Nostoc sp. PCC 7524]AFY50061.1 hypothetical protein Nos7524_4302 [Nostoc sp. PCC 7524]